MVVEIRVEEAQWWLCVSLSEKKDKVVVVRSTSLTVDGDDGRDKLQGREKEKNK